MALSEGGREVLEAARKRLATAKSKVSVSLKNVQMQQQMLDSLKSMHAADEKEYKEAQTALEEAEKKYEVISIDLDDDPEPTDKNEGNNKRRKVSLSPQSQSNNSNNNANSTAGNNNTATENTAAAGSPTNSNMSNSSINAPTITLASSSTFNVEGSGLEELNGTYNRLTATHNGASMYSKQGQWRGNAVVYVLFWDSSTKQWYIGHRQQDVDAGRGVTGWFCRSQPNVSSLAPPRNGWSMSPNIVSSSSHVDQVVVLGCVASGISGIYKQENGSLHEGAPLFTREVGSTTFAIYRVPSNQRYWYIGRWNRSTNSELPSSRLFKSNLYNYRREDRLIPPEDGWVSCSKQRSSQQAPKCHFLSAVASSSAAATAVNELFVSGCGLPMANGTYKRTNRRCNGIPTYTKTAGQITFTISSVFSDKYQQWKIYQNGWSNIIYKGNANHRVDGKLDGAPLDNSTWSVVEGVRPPPQVKRG